ncbi:MAG: lipase, partial [Acidimicrobiales bacterium]
VQPYNSGFIASPQSTNITVQDQCALDHSDHVAVVADPTTSADVLNALDPAHPGPVPCQLVLPVVG